jgi:short-chain fatty acids transporter
MSNPTRSWLPSPFSIAVLLSLLTWLLAWWYTAPGSNQTLPHALQLLAYWEKGFWELLDFGMQMMLILILGHVLALSAPAAKLIHQLVQWPQNQVQAIVLVTFSSCVMGLLNWGLGLVFGAILAREMAAHFLQKNQALNYPLLGAGAYACMLVWHGGLSGSAPLKVAEAGHFLEASTGIIPVSQTLFSPMNLMAMLLALLLLPAFTGWLAGRSTPATYELQQVKPIHFLIPASGAEKLDHWPWAGVLTGLIMLFTAFSKPWYADQNFWQLINLNYLNFVLFGACLLAHGSFYRFTKAINQAMSDGSGILVQFPLYAGIMGMVKYSGLMEQFTQTLIQLASADSLPILTFLSAALVNVFVPSGGGQWMVQGPLVMQAALELHVSLPKVVMALAYGDQLTNMLQPFWALPLLAITGLQPRQLLPYSLLLLCVGMLIFVSVLIIF